MLNRIARSPSKMFLVIMNTLTVMSRKLMTRMIGERMCNREEETGIVTSTNEKPRRSKPMANIP